jgi:putative hydrolase of the HAD superfamily
MLHAVLFDLDDTLVDRTGAFRECVHAHFRDPAVTSELFRLDNGGRGDRAVFFRFWERHSRAPMTQASFGQLLAEHLRPDPALLGALDSLVNRFKLGVITNGSGESQRRKFITAGLANVIPPQRLWISEEVGTAKPDPAIFRLASQALGEPVENCLYIGDREYEDHAGATAVGMRARRVETVLNAERLQELIQEESNR